MDFPGTMHGLEESFQVPLENWHMGIGFRIDKEKGHALVVWDGLVSANEFLAHVDRLAAHADWPPPKRLHLVDLRTTSVDASMDSAALERAAARYGQHQDRIAGLRAAIVAGEAFSKAVEFERLISQYGASVVVFNLLSTACTWLDLSDSEIEPKLQQLRAELREVPARSALP